MSWRTARMFIYDPLRYDVQAIDLTEMVTVGLPAGWRLRSALDINDHMVVVGNMEEISTGERRPVAIDLATTDPVVDLLPDVGVDSHGIQINENGDILGITGVVGAWETWIFSPDLSGDHDPNGNPRLYGASLRPVRNGTPLNMSGKSYDELPLSGLAHLFKMNNPVDDSPAQVAGTDADSNAFRYTLGDAEPEGFPEVNLVNIANLNDSGTFSGTHRGPKIKGQISVDPFRFNDSLELLPMPMDNDSTILFGMNSSGDLVTWVHVFHDDWGWVKIDDLVVAEEEADIQAWFSGSVYVFGINDRGGPEYGYAGQITGHLSDGRIFILTPFDPTPEP